MVEPMNRNFFTGLREGQRAFGEDIAHLVAFVLLSIAYIIGIGIPSLIAKIIGKHFLELHINQNKKSYWKDFELAPRGKEEYYRQF
jgi:hypothetical protein